MERITKENLVRRLDNVNRRMHSRGSQWRYAVEARNGHTALDRIRRDPSQTYIGEHDLGGVWLVQDTVTVGTKREIADFLHAMIVALDDSTRTD